MPFVKPGELIPADTLRGRMGKPNGLGWVIFGWTEFGDDNYYQGVYQQRRNRKWDGNGRFIIGKVQKNFFQKPAWPVNTITEARTITRNNFRNAVQAWQALTTSEKNAINKIAHKKGKRGYDWFLSQTLKSF